MNPYSNKKLIVFDLDETLTQSKMQISNEDKIVFENLLRVKKVGIISGGTLKRIGLQIADHIAFNLLTQLYILPGNGSSLYQYDIEKKEWNLNTKNF